MRTTFSSLLTFFVLALWSFSSFGSCDGVLVIDLLRMQSSTQDKLNAILSNPKFEKNLVMIETNGKVIPVLFADKEMSGAINAVTMNRFEIMRKSSGLINKLALLHLGSAAILAGSALTGIGFANGAESIKLFIAFGVGAVGTLLSGELLDPTISRWSTYLSDRIVGNFLKKLTAIKAKTAQLPVAVVSMGSHENVKDAVANFIRENGIPSRQVEVNEFRRYINSKTFAEPAYTSPNDLSTIARVSDLASGVVIRSASDKNFADLELLKFIGGYEDALVPPQEALRDAKVDLIFARNRDLFGVPSKTNSDAPIGYAVTRNGRTAVHFPAIEDKEILAEMIDRYRYALMQEASGVNASAYTQQANDKFYTLVGKEVVRGTQKLIEATKTQLQAFKKFTAEENPFSSGERMIQEFYDLNLEAAGTLVDAESGQSGSTREVLE